MNADVKKAWLEALRSGEYKQAQGTLRREDSYCCLGVLCDVYRKSGINNDANWRRNESTLTYNFTAGLTGGVAFVPPTPVIDWAEMNYDDPDVDYQDPVSGFPRTIALTSCNDDLKLSFNQIADLIEKQL